MQVQELRYQNMYRTLTAVEIRIDIKQKLVHEYSFVPKNPLSNTSSHFCGGWREVVPRTEEKIRGQKFTFVHFGLIWKVSAVFTRGDKRVVGGKYGHRTELRMEYAWHLEKSLRMSISHLVHSWKMLAFSNCSLYKRCKSMESGTNCACHINERSVMKQKNKAEEEEKSFEFRPGSKLSKWTLSPSWKCTKSPIGSTRGRERKRESYILKFLIFGMVSFPGLVPGTAIWNKSSLELELSPILKWNISLSRILRRLPPGIGTSSSSFGTHLQRRKRNYILLISSIPYFYVIPTFQRYKSRWSQLRMERKYPFSPRLN